jgi:hypothetical protein
LIWGKWEQNYFSENPKKDSTALQPDGQITCGKNHSLVQLRQAGRAHPSLLKDFLKTDGLPGQARQ